MVRGMISVILMLCLVVVLTAQNNGISREEVQHRRAELNSQAEQIKRATRFQGRISVSPEMNKIDTFEGRFENITFPAMDDTLGIERTFDEIVHRIIPFFPVNREDLERVNLNIRENIIGVDYRQTANGYRIEGGASLIITYTTRRRSVYINNSLTYLDPSVLPTEPRITREEVVRMFYDNVHIPETRINLRSERPSFTLMYCYERKPGSYAPSSPSRYRLAWRGGATNTFIVDAITGEIMFNGRIHTR